MRTGGVGGGSLRKRAFAGAVAARAGGGAAETPRPAAGGGEPVGGSSLSQGSPSKSPAGEGAVHGSRSRMAVQPGPGGTGSVVVDIKPEAATHGTGQAQTIAQPQASAGSSSGSSSGGSSGANEKGLGRVPGRQEALSSAPGRGGASAALAATLAALEQSRALVAAMEVGVRGKRSHYCVTDGGADATQRDPHTWLPLVAAPCRGRAATCTACRPPLLP